MGRTDFGGIGRVGRSEQGDASERGFKDFRFTPRRAFADCAAGGCSRARSVSAAAMLSTKERHSMALLIRRAEAFDAGDRRTIRRVGTGPVDADNLLLACVESGARALFLRFPRWRSTVGPDFGPL